MISKSGRLPAGSPSLYKHTIMNIWEYVVAVGNLNICAEICLRCTRMLLFHLVPFTIPLMYSFNIHSYGFAKVFDCSNCYPLVRFDPMEVCFCITPYRIMSLFSPATTLLCAFLFASDLLPLKSNQPHTKVIISSSTKHGLPSSGVFVPACACVI